MDSTSAYPQSTSDWLPYQKIITHFYRDEKRSLKEVQQLLELRYRFKATEKMYKRKIQQWGLDKKLKRREVLGIAQLQAQRASAGKESIFLLRGRVVNMNNINRYLKRSKLSFQEQENPWTEENHVSSATDIQMPNLVCRTPSPRPLAADPGVILDGTESFYLSFDQYLLGQVQARLWAPVDGSSQLNNSLSKTETWVDFLETVNLGAIRHKNGKYQQAMWYWRIASTQLETVIQSQNYYQLLNLISGMGRLVDYDAAVAKILKQYLGNLVATILRANSPQRRVLQSLSNLDPEAFRDLILFTRRCCLPIFRSHFSDHQDFVLFWQAALAQTESYKGIWAFSPLLLAQMVARLCSKQQITAVLQSAAERLISAFEVAQHYREAEYLSELRIERLLSLKESTYVVGQLFRAWTCLGRIQTCTGNRNNARRSFLLAINLYEKLKQLKYDEDRSWQERFMQDMLSNLIKLELSMGLLIEADVHKRQLAVIGAALDKEAQQQLIDENLFCVTRK